MEAVIEKLDIRLNVRSASDHSAQVETSVSPGTVAEKVNEIIDRLNAEPTIKELIEYLSGSAFASDHQLAKSIQRAHAAWKEKV